MIEHLVMTSGFALWLIMKPMVFETKTGLLLMIMNFLSHRC